MVKEKEYSFMSIEHVEFNFDLCEEREGFLSELEKSVPKHVEEFNSKGSYWDIKQDNIVSCFNLCINGGKLHTADYCGAFISDFLDFLPQAAYNNDKNLICGFDCESQFDCLTIRPVDNELIRVSTFTNCSRRPKIQSDIIIKKDTFLKQILDILLKIKKDTEKKDKGKPNRRLNWINKAIDNLQLYFENPNAFREQYTPVHYARVFDIAYKDLDGIWKFYLCSDNDEKCEPEYWEKQKQEGKIFDYDWEEQDSEYLAKMDYEKQISVPITKEELKDIMETDMSNRLEKNWVYSTLTKNWYSTNEIMPEPKEQLNIIHTRLSYNVEIDLESYPRNEDEKLRSYINDTYDENGNLYEDEDDWGYLRCWLVVKDVNSTVCRFQFDYRNNSKIRTALNKAKKGEYVRFDLGGYQYDKMHIWNKKWDNPNSKDEDDIAVACYNETEKDCEDIQQFYILAGKCFIDCFLNALDEIEHKINVVKNAMKSAKKLKLESKFKTGKKYNNKIEYLENFIGGYACVHKDSLDGWGIINKNFEWVIKPESVTIYGEEHPRYGKEIKGWIVKYTYLHNIDGKLFIAQKQDKKQFVIDIKGDIQIPHISDKVYYKYLNNELYFAFVDSDKTYITNSKGKDILTLDFEIGEEFYLFDEIIIASKDNKFGIINWKGKILIDFIFSDIKPLSDNLDFIPVKYMEIWGFVNKKGKIVDMKIKEQSEADLKHNQVK